MAKPAKIAAIKSAADKLDGVLNPAQRPAPPTDADNIAALKSGAQNLLLLADAVPGPGGDAAKRLAADLDKLAAAPPTVRASMQTVLTRPLAMDLEALRHALRPEGVTRATLPEAIRRSWVSPDGRARVELVPKAGQDSSRPEFARAVMQAEPTATGPAIGELEWGATIIHAFVVAGVCALVSIAVLLWIALRRVSDVLLTLVPLLVGGCGHAGAVRAPELPAQLCEHHSAARPARRRRGVQDLLRDGLAVGTVRFLAISADARGAL